MFSLKPLERTLHKKQRAEWIENNKNNIYTIGKCCGNLLSEIRNEKLDKLKIKLSESCKMQNKRMRKQMI